MRPPSMIALLTVAAASTALHTPVRAQSTSSPHGTLPASLDCTACHEANAWTPAKADMDFDHERDTRFTLHGQHADAPCTSCHLGLRFDEPQIDQNDCASCHLDVHQDNLSGDCVGCHNTLAFTDVAGLNIHAGTNFPLVGAHMQISCESCHLDDRGGAFTPLDSDCIACHQIEFAGTSATIDHADAGFSQRCEECHSPLTWSGGVPFDHVSASAGFALVGAHTDMRCANCHIRPGNALIHTPNGQNDCIACHQDAHQREHPGYPTNCLDCHNINDWDGATFDHIVVANGFDLVDAHAQVACTGCHVPGTNALRFTPNGQNDCAACHQSDYDQVHTGTGFPAACLTCHNQTRWDDATFLDHETFFPIYSGPHTQARWQQCSTCHVNPNDFQTFTCFNCHEHSQVKMDDKHKGEAGYVYDSQRCLSCHPGGRG